ncbi:DNA repair protein Sae2/CtIP family-containing protein [Strongyloides ratti]|uniref:DNA repair protein Sae2/CtIP family-containing protein n=1 Tax=Strongyloides ratti TaxID=34506 RepID=A0A090LGQ8_STRRB|nr:DNA repair protein Sae2/CtIP family-containing protein [Strongyloides ratti]CEF68962.1 DNA repair protein Sae2/CtIP family-containing protein [Strongyloides ratti]
MESKNSAEFPSLFLTDISSYSDDDKENKKKKAGKKFSKKSLEKLGIPSLFSNEIPFASTSSYSLKDELKSKLLKLKVHSNKNHLTNDNISQNQELDDSIICIDTGECKKPSKKNTTLNKQDQIMEVNTTVKENNAPSDSLDNNSDNTSITYPKTSTQLAPERPPSFSVSEISDANTETSSDTFESKILSSGFISVYKQQASLPLKEYKEIDENKTIKAIRNKACRSTLQGHDCECCSGYYNALQLKTPEKIQRINEVSRHRGINFRKEKTPEGYWDKSFLEKSEQRKRGLFIESNSPILIKKYRKKFKFGEEVNEANETK